MSRLLADEIHVGDTQTKFLVTIKDGTTIVDVGAPIDELFIKFEKPDFVTVDIAAALETDGSDGQIFVLSNITTLILDQPGIWKMQGRVGNTSTSPASVWRSNVVEFQVYENL